MNNLLIEESISINAEPALVRSQFGDVAHHQRAALHKGVRFEILDCNEHRCHYRQISSVGPLRLKQEVELPLTTTGPLVNTITKGQFTGGTISFTITPAGDDEQQTQVTARLEAPLRGPQRLLAPLLRRQVHKSLSRGLAEDKSDLESGSYSP